MNTFIVGDFRVSVSPISGIFSVKDCFAIHNSFVGRNVFGVGFFILFKQVVALLNYEFFGCGNVVSGFVGHLVSVFVVAEFVFVVRKENGDTL